MNDRGRHILGMGLASLLAINSLRAEDLKIDADFPGGNIIVEKVEGDDVFVRPELRDTLGNWFYWNFRVREGQGRALSVHFTKGNPVGARGPAVSTDGGKTWKWLGVDAVGEASFRYTVPADAAEVRFAFAFPYQLADLDAFLARFKDSRHVRRESLATTAKRRSADVLLLGRLDGKAAHRVALTCRHHSCESMASYSLEGIMETVLAGGDDGKWLRKNVEFFVVPMVDIDGVEDGDQGKNRKPRDHNRDYDGESLYPQVKAIRERLPKWSDGKLRLALDLHCPGVRGTHNEWIYFVGGPDEENWKEVNRFAAVLEKVQTGPLAFKREHNLPFGQAWNKAANFAKGKPFARWAAELPEVRAAATMEIPYANVDGREVTGDSARAFGRDLAKAIRVYLEAE